MIVLPDEFWWTTLFGGGSVSDETGLRLVSTHTEGTAQDGQGNVNESRALAHRSKYFYFKEKHMKRLFNKK